MDWEHTNPAARAPLPEDPECPNGWDDPFERWMELADLLLREKVDSESPRH